jgi:hypothetical protein
MSFDMEDLIFFDQQYLEFQPFDIKQIASELFKRRKI